MGSMNAFSARLESLALPLVATLVATKRGDVVRLARESDGTWMYCRVEDQLPDGDLVCSIVDAQSWPSILVDGIVPGVKYVVAADRVLSVVRPA